MQLCSTCIYSNCMMNIDSLVGQLLQTTSECIYGIFREHYWLRTLELLSASFNEGQKLKLTIGEFFSLTVELLRWKPEHPSSGVPSLSQCITTHLLRALSLVERCGDLYVLKRFVDILLKTEQKASSVEFITYIAPVFKAMFEISVCKTTIHHWMEENLMSLLLASSFRQQAKKKSCHRLIKDNEIVDIFVRKIILLIVKCIASLLRAPSQQKLEQPTAGSYSMHVHVHCICTLTLSSLNLHRN